LFSTRGPIPITWRTAEDQPEMKELYSCLSPAAECGREIAAALIPAAVATIREEKADYFDALPPVDLFLDG